MSEQAEALVGIGLELRFVLFGLHIGLDVPLSAFEIERVFSDCVADQISAKEYHFHKSSKAEVSGFVDDYEHDTIRVRLSCRGAQSLLHRVCDAAHYELIRIRKADEKSQTP